MFKPILHNLKPLLFKLKRNMGNPKYRRLAILSGLLYLYLAGILAQFLNNRYQWVPGKELYLPSVNPLKGLAMLFTPFGVQALLGLFFFTVIAVLLYFLFREDREGMKYDKERNFWYSQKGVYGTAGWMSDGDMLRCFDLTPVEHAHTVTEIIYGEKDGYVLSRKPDSRLAEHVAVLGSSGTMKSRTYARGKIISCALKGESMVISDPKGELCSDTKAYLEDMGYNVKVLNLVDPYNSASFDGLDGCRENLLYVSHVVEAVISNTGGEKGDHFFDAAEGNLLSALIYLQLEQDTGEWPSIKGAYQTLTGIRSVEELSELFDEYPGSRAEQAYNLFRLASPNVQGNVIIGLGSRLSILQNDEIADLMCYPEMDFRALGTEKTVYFLILSDQDNTMRFVSAMYFSLLFLRLVQFADNECPDKKLPVGVNLILDEFCSIIGSINSFHIKLSNVRSRNIKITIIFQAIGQLMNRYPQNMWSEILGNCDCTLVLGCNDPVSAEYVSDRSGEVTIYADTVMKQKNIFLPSALQPVYRHSEGAGRRKLMTPDEVLRMPHNEMLIMLRGEQVIKINKFDYTRNAESMKFRPEEVKGLAHIEQPEVIPENPGELHTAKQAAASPPEPDEILDSQGRPIRGRPISMEAKPRSGDMGTPPAQHGRRGGSLSHTHAAPAGKEVVRDVAEGAKDGGSSKYTGPPSSMTPPKI